MSVAEASKDISQYKPKWQERFAFFDAHGAPNAKTYRPALKALPFKKKACINMNFIAFFFGPIYLFVLGLWKKNLALLGAIFVFELLVDIAFSLAGMETPRAIGNGIGIAGSIAYGLTTNYAYYLKECKGEQSWYPFTGMRW
ncbi:DUF2628 domain-containing protein [Pseudomonas sp. 22-AL-CL-001]|uniref:DUF2628 domain-containing protein n=1 Tax=Pseudomonas alabamensis TaxID=3064349 RepID=UPI0021D8A5B5|nr:MULTISPECIES: DUF2628 domain-containing protein [Pseudomonas]MDO7908938.1 DUF2628 domain-containing protein [Pseudomonas sp. 22-AL-CL-001]